LSLDLADPRWEGLAGGYRRPYDPRPAIRAIVADQDRASAWAELWQELHHQGDIGEAAYAALSPLAAWARATGSDDWNVYALAATLEECRADGSNPPPSEWLAQSYAVALDDLFHAALAVLPSARSDELIRGALAMLAIGKGQPLLAQIALLAADEQAELLDGTR
jgi:hypothetical protein